MPDWLRDVLLAVGAFIGGRAVNAWGDSIKRGQELTRSVDRLTSAVEHIGEDLRDIRGEIHKQVGELKVEIHDQVSALKSELHIHKTESEQRVRAVEERVDMVGGRIDVLASATGWQMSKPNEPVRLRKCPEGMCEDPMPET